MAIVAFPGFYKICTTTRGYRTVGDTPMVGVHDVVNFEDFDPASYG